jgi:iron complex transport system ATP-binding protein
MSHVPFLQAQDIQVSFGATPVLQGVNLEVLRGEVLGLAGPNGAGKTTLLRVFSGSLRPQRGVVLMEGTALHNLPPRERARRVAVVPQDPTTPVGFTALQIVLMGRNPHLGLLEWEGPKDVEAAHRAMEMTGTWEFAERPLATLSGGEKQRVFIARALAQASPLLLLDEPTAQLDIGYQARILDLVLEARSQAKVTVVAAMHDLSLAAQYCDRIAVLHQGTLLALGPPEQVLTPELLSQVFETSVLVASHPLYQTPVVFPYRGHQDGEKGPA